MRWLASCNKDGNVSNDTHTRHWHVQGYSKIAKLVENYPPITAVREDVFIAASTRVKRGDLKLGAEVWVLSPKYVLRLNLHFIIQYSIFNTYLSGAVPGLAEAWASIKGQWIERIFNSWRGALLIMHRLWLIHAAPTFLLSLFFLKYLAKVEALKDPQTFFSPRRCSLVLRILVAYTCRVNVSILLFTFDW